MSQELFNQAFLEAQREFPPIHKGRTADMGNYQYSYADLGDILDAVVPILHEHGIALSQPPVSEDGKIGVLTRLIHESGHIEDCGTLLLSAGNNPQAAGSAMTYARRYAACAALGIVADEDDDGRAAIPEEVAPKATNQLKAELLDQVNDDRELAAAIYMAAAAAVGVHPVDPLPVSKLEAMRAEVDARATEAMSDAE